VRPVPSTDIQQIVASSRKVWPERSFLARLPPLVLDEFIAVGSGARFASNEVLIQEGRADTDVYLLLSAFVKVTAQLDGGGHALLAVRVGGDVVGELAATDNETRSASVRASGRDPVVAAVLTQSDFVRLLKHHPHASMTLISAIGHKLRSATRRRVDYIDCTPRVRLARALVELADDYGQRIGANSILVGVNLTQIELGTLVGVTKVTAQRALRELREEGLIITSGRRPIIRDIDALRTVAYPPGQPKDII
jgi:CRP/FNR family transcriptional regulator, cyclic AMP receptor protein